MPLPAGRSQPPLLHAERPRRPLRIGLTPLIDVVFILLVFFMLASPFMQHRTIELSSTESGGHATGADGALLIEVRAHDLRFGGEVMDLDAIAKRIEQAVAGDPGQRVLVKPAAGVDLQRVVGVLDRLTVAGAADLLLLRQR